MSTENEPEHADAASVEGAGAAQAPATAGRDEGDTPAEQQAAAAEGAIDSPSENAEPTAESADPSETSIYVRRSRTPTLGFWVAVAIALPAVVALISAPFFNFADIGGVLNFVLLTAVIVGLPLATIAAVIDSVRHRNKG